MAVRISNTCFQILIVISLVMLTACANMGSNYRPVVDPENNDMAKFETDLADCQNIAKEQSIAAKAGKGTILGAAAGAIVGVVTGAILGNAGGGAALGGGYGASAGAVQGTASGIRDQETIIKNCMIGRGYRVLK